MARSLILGLLSLFGLLAAGKRCPPEPLPHPAYPRRVRVEVGRGQRGGGEALFVFPQ